MRKNPYSWFQRDGKAKDQFFSDELNPNQWPVKNQKARRNPLSSVIMSQRHSEWWKAWGYDLTNGPGLNFGKGRRTLLQSFVPKGKTPDYYHRTRRGLGYVSTPIPSASDSGESLGHDCSSGTSSWESDASVGNIFRELSVNMVSTSHLEDGNEEMIQSDTDP